MTPAPFDVDSFVKGYAACALWADCIPLDPDAVDVGGMLHLSYTGRTLQQLRAFLEPWIAANAEDLAAYVHECRTGGREGFNDADGPPEAWAGHDLRLTSGGHGAGFWDRGLGELGERLSDAARALPCPEVFEAEGYDVPTATFDLPGVVA